MKMSLTKKITFFFILTVYQPTIKNVLKAVKVWCLTVVKTLADEHVLTTTLTENF